MAGSDKKSKVTLQQIADALGISRGTVDRAVHSRGRINEDTRRRILDKAADMGYIDDKIARFSTLKQKSAFLVLLPRSGSFFYTLMLQGIRSAAADIHDPTLELLEREYDPESPGSLEAALKEIRGTENAKGVMLVPAGQIDTAMSLPGAPRLPYVTVNTDLPDSRRLCFVGQDLYRSGRLGGELLHKIRHGGDICILSGYKGLWAHEQRIAGVLDYLKDIGSGNPPQIVYCDDDQETARNMTKDFLTGRNKGAMIALTAAATVGAVRARYETSDLRGRPLIGFDYNEELSAALDEGVCDALIGQNPELQGTYAFKLLYHHVFKDYSIPEKQIIVPTELFFKELKPEQHIFPDFSR